MRLRPFSGTKRVLAIACTARQRVGRKDRGQIDMSSASLSGARSLSIGTNHCGVQRKITLALLRHSADRNACNRAGRHKPAVASLKRLAQGGADRAIGRVEFGIDDTALAAQPGQSARYLPSPSANTGLILFALHSRKSSSP
jgi:hypothetical protein